MRRLLQVVAFLLISWSLIAPLAAYSQQAESDSQRKVVTRVIPIYPPLARTMNVRGAVRLDAVVQANGTVKSIESKGGHPLLVQAAQSAVQKWKWAPAREETHEVIEIHFDPH
jgi:protein TonB